MFSLRSFDLPASALLASSQDKQVETVEIGDISEISQPACPAYYEPLEVMSCTTDRLDLPSKREKQREFAHSRLDELFFFVRIQPASSYEPSLSPFSDLYFEMEESWGKPYSACIHILQHANYADVEGVRGNQLCVDAYHTHASYLSTGEASTLKALSLPTKTAACAN